jgi:hypothetical protein
MSDKNLKNTVLKKSCGCSCGCTPTENDAPKIMRIEWQRLITDEKTCPRCGGTEEELDKAVATLKQSLAPLDIEVTLEKRAISIEEFKEAPLESNQILINSRPLEHYVGGTVGQSQCCDVCGPEDCRTINVDGQTYETIPSKIIIQAGLAAATQLLLAKNGKSCCSD